MSTEQHRQPERPRPAQEFGFTEREELFDRVSHRRLLAFIEDEATIVHKVEDSHNNYGAFLFVTLSRPGQERRIVATMWGLGYHEYRERWLANEWFWYLVNPFPEAQQQEMDKDDVLELLQRRHEEVAAYAGAATQTARGRLFEQIADLTDEDGAWAEMQDLPEWLFDEDE